MERVHVVMCFLLRRRKEEGRSIDELLILLRSGRVGSYRGRWAAVSGYVEMAPDLQAYAEMQEEVGLEKSDVQLLRKGEPLEALDEFLDKTWVVHTYLFLVSDPGKIRLDWEHTEGRWINPADIGNFDTVPKLKESLQQVYAL